MLVCPASATADDVSYNPCKGRKFDIAHQQKMQQQQMQQQHELSGPLNMKQQRGSRNHSMLTGSNVLAT